MKEAERPVCECHGEAMYWNKDTRKKTGGHWTCAVIAKARQRDYAMRNPAKLKARKQAYRDANRARFAAGESAIPVSKSCARCHHVKPAVGFTLVPSRADGLHSWCKKCLAAWKAAKYEADPIWRHRALMSTARQKRLSYRKALNEDVAPNPALAEYVARSLGEALSS